MKLLALRHTYTIKPPFKNDIADLVVWASPLSAGIIGKKLEVGGVLVSPNVVVTTQYMEEDKPEIIVQGERFNGKKLTYENDEFWFSYYQIDRPVPWVGLPFRKELEMGTFLFSFSPLPEVFCFEPIPVEKSKAVQSFEDKGRLKISLHNVASTLPIVDRFGYFVGLGIGECKGECIAQPFCMKNTRL